MWPKVRAEMMITAVKEDFSRCEEKNFAVLLFLWVLFVLDLTCLSRLNNGHIMEQK